MNPQAIDRGRAKTEARALLRTAQVPPRTFIALYLGIALALDLLVYWVPTEGILPIFLSVLSYLISLVLGAGFVLYCMAVRRGERAEYLTLFDGFSFAGRIIALQVIQGCLILMWSMLFVFPGIVAAYRYRFALYNLYENPGLSPLEALDLSRRQTAGYKMQLLLLDFSYLGWSMLASLPNFAANLFYYQELMSSMGGSFTAASAAWGSAALFESFGWFLFSGVWTVIVNIFFLPQYTCVLLEYFETAKRTSSAGSLSRENLWLEEGDDSLDN